MTLPTITIRSANSNDAKAIAYAQVETWNVAFRGVVADEFLDSMSEVEHTVRWSEILQYPQYQVFVAERESEGVVRFANGGPEREGRGDFAAELRALYVLPSWHGQGIGGRLVTTAAQRL